jgi:hypothetical protein
VWALLFCTRELWSLCDNSNPNAWMAEKLVRLHSSGLFGYSHMTGGYAAARRSTPGAVRRRRPDPDPRRHPRRRVLFLSDILPTGYMAAETAISSPATRSRSGGAARSGSWRS